MNGNRNWLGWLGVGLGAIALLITLGAGRFDLRYISGSGNLPAPQAYTQQGGQSQNSAPQSASAAPNANTQSRDGRQGGALRRGEASGVNAGLSFGRWFSFPFKLFAGLRDAALVVLLALLGMWLLRGGGFMSNRAAQATPASAPAQPSAPAQSSPTGESYVDEAGKPTE